MAGENFWFHWIRTYHGAIHDGHLSLVEKSIEICQNTIVSIYLNPAQFSPCEDLDRYPKTVDTDLKKLSHFQVDCVFFTQ